MCLFPWTASLQPEGGRPKPNPDGELKLPCGKCQECLKKRAFEWGTRARHEIAIHDENCFLTLTYDQEHLKSEFIIKDTFKNFMKALRKKTKKKLTYIVSHEYGEKKFRPHHHCIIFGWSPNNQKLLKTNNGNPLFTSPDLDKLWKHGFHSIGEANEKTAFYIAKYALKGKSHELTTEAGECFTGVDSFDSSKRPGIGLRFFYENMEQIVHYCGLVPRYYEKLIKEGFPKYFTDQLTPSAYVDLLKRRTILEEVLEENKLEKIRDRSLQQRYSKYIISEQEKTKSSELREGTTSPEFRPTKSYLKQEIARYNQGM